MIRERVDLGGVQVGVPRAARKSADRVPDNLRAGSFFLFRPNGGNPTYGGTWDSGVLRADSPGAASSVPGTYRLVGVNTEGDSVHVVTIRDADFFSPEGTSNTLTTCEGHTGHTY